MATYAIGDIQGCYEPLRELVRKIGYRRGTDHLLLAGDLVNRGPGSLETLRWVIEQGDSVTAVLGNHDLHLLAAAAGAAEAKGRDTIAPILDAPDCDDLIAWVRRLPLLVRGEGWVMVHAGLLPQWSVDVAHRLAGEVEAVLREGDWQRFLGHVRGPRPDHWRDDLTGIDRLRVITNALTRLRFCTDDGRMEFAHNGAPEAAPARYRPWFDVPGRKSVDTTIICGHWAALGLVNRPDLLALDSGCVWGNALTAVRLEDRAVFQVEC